jgi:cytidine deaminase
MSFILTNEIKQELVETARQALQYAYVPYSHYPVGAALLTADGKIFTGVNIENAAYPLTICAERVAVFKAVSAGIRDFQAIAVVTRNAGSPCGSCRQVLAEFGLETRVLLANVKGEISLESSVAGLLPGAFGPQHLQNLGPD